MNWKITQFIFLFCCVSLTWLRQHNDEEIARIRRDAYNRAVVCAGN